MKRLLIAVGLVILAACSSTAPSARTASSSTALKGVHTVYVAAPYDGRILTGIEKALPDVRVVNDPAQADSIIQFGSQAPTPSLQTYETVTSESGGTDGNGNLTTKTVTMPVGSNPLPKKAVVAYAVNRSTHQSVVIYDGFTDYIYRHLAENFAKAWQEQNRS